MNTTTQTTVLTAVAAAIRNTATSNGRAGTKAEFSANELRLSVYGRTGFARLSVDDNVLTVTYTRTPLTHLSVSEATFTTDSINEDAVAAYVYAIING